MIPGLKRRSGQNAGLRHMMTGIQGAAAFALACALGTSAAAQSAYGCRALETHSALPSVEGKDGVFFRIRPDLQSHRALSGQTARQIGALSRALATRGTTLVMLVVPPRAQVLAHHLPAQTSFVGYDPDIAAAVQRDMIDRLRAAGVTVAKPDQALRQAALAGQEVFFATDPRPTALGSRIMAQTVADVLAAHPDTKALPRAKFKTTKQVTGAALVSPMRARLQLACQDALPQVETPRFVTAGAAITSVSTTGVAAVIGTGMTGAEALNFAGFLSEFSGLRAGGYGVEGGGAYAAMSSYLTSLDFEQTPPQVLVWEVPAWVPFGQHGDQPMAELIAAAAQTCSIPLPLVPGEAPGALRADLRGLAPGQRVTLSLDTGGTAAQKVTFRFASADGTVRARSIYRNPDQILTGRFYLPLSGLTETGLASVDIELPQPFGRTPRLTACLQGATP